MKVGEFMKSVPDACAFYVLDCDLVSWGEEGECGAQYCGGWWHLSCASGRVFPPQKKDCSVWIGIYIYDAVEKYKTQSYISSLHNTTRGSDKFPFECSIGTNRRGWCGTKKSSIWYDTPFQTIGTNTSAWLNEYAMFVGSGIIIIAVMTSVKAVTEEYTRAGV